MAQVLGGSPRGSPKVFGAKQGTCLLFSLLVLGFHSTQVRPAPSEGGGMKREPQRVGWDVSVYIVMTPGSSPPVTWAGLVCLPEHDGTSETCGPSRQFGEPVLVTGTEDSPLWGLYFKIC